jgi:hypothetical protein
VPSITDITADIVNTENSKRNRVLTILDQKMNNFSIAQSITSQLMSDGDIDLFNRFINPFIKELGGQSFNSPADFINAWMVYKSKLKGNQFSGITDTQAAPVLSRRASIEAPPPQSAQSSRRSSIDEDEFLKQYNTLAPSIFKIFLKVEKDKATVPEKEIDNLIELMADLNDIINQIDLPFNEKVKAFSFFTGNEKSITPDELGDELIKVLSEIHFFKTARSMGGEGIFKDILKGEMLAGNNNPLLKDRNYKKNWMTKYKIRNS